MAIHQRYLKIGTVGFIDLLGFSAKVEAIVTEDDLHRLELDISRVQRWFDHKPIDDDIKTSQRITDKRVLAFSDCLVICVSATSELSKHEGDFDVLMADLANMAMAQGQCAVNGIFLRGGVDFGVWYRRKDILISSAMIKAYHLEQNACVPMIALTDGLYQHLSQHPHRRYYHESYDPIQRMFRRFDNIPNGTSHWFIDYMPICLGSLDGSITGEDRKVYFAADSVTRDRMRNEAYWRDCQEWTSWHRDRIRAAYAAATVDAVRAKYLWLATYHDDAVQRFFAEAPPELLIGNLTA